MTDQNRKTLRSFYCRDYLWELYEQMTHEMGCSMDYLINESMRLYARNRDMANGDPNANGAHGGGAPAFGAQPSNPGFGAQPSNPGFGTQPSNPSAPVDRFNVNPQPNMNQHRTFERVPSVGGQNGPRPPQPPQPGGAFGAAPAPPQPPQPGGLAGGPPPPPRPQSGGWQQPQQPAPPQPPMGGGAFGGAPQPPQPPQSMGGGGGFGAQPQRRAPLYLVFNNNRYPIDKDKFVIGRGSQQTDLTIRDGNISRKHCAVIFHNGSYYIKDLGSTNGIEYRGNRIESKKIDEGDVFYLCDYELRFSYR